MKKSDAKSIPCYMPANFYTEDNFLQKLLRYYFQTEELQWAEHYLQTMGTLAATKIAPLVLPSDQHPPQLTQYNAIGDRIDHIAYHSSYQDIARYSYEFGLVGLGYCAQVRTKNKNYGALLKFSLGYLFSQTASVVYCPVCMTDGTVKILEKYGSTTLKHEWLPRLTSMDPDNFSDSGMYLTEIQGGSDVGSNECQAYQENETWKLNGAKWFCSNAGSDCGLVLARPTGAATGTAGLSLFLLPKKLANGDRNKILINRLKNKLGTREMATAEIEFNAACAYPVGDLKKGFSYMTEMLNLSRIYNAVWSIGLIRRAWLEANYYAQYRIAFGKAIIQYPLVAAKLTELKLNSEQSTCLVFALLHYLDRYERDNSDQQAMHMVRLLTPVVKFYTAEKALTAAHDAIEIIGGNGCIEDFIVAKIFRDCQILAIWEGTANILCLDLLRVIANADYVNSFLQLTQQQIKTISDDKRQSFWQAKWSDIKQKFLQVANGADNMDGELICRQLAWQVADFMAIMLWECHHQKV